MFTILQFGLSQTSINLVVFRNDWTNWTHCKVSCANTGPSTNTTFYFLQDRWPSVLVTFDNDARHFVISVPDITESSERGMKTDLDIGAGARKQKKSWTKRARDTTVTRLWRPTGGTWIIGVSLIAFQISGLLRQQQHPQQFSGPAGYGGAPRVDNG